MYIVTGVSRGLGKAVAQLLLKKNEKVIGVGRTSIIEHKNYTFVSCDLSISDELESLRFNFSGERVTLINNAGILGEIKRISENDNWDLAKILQVNTIAPMLLAKRIYSQVEDKNSFTLVNISSGAANRAIPSWAGYCASKAALNMLTETFYLEEKEKGRSPKVFAVAPGIIDSDMQKQIRSISKNDFSAVDNFKKLKENNELFSPDQAAEKLFYLLNLKNTTSIFQDLRKI